MIPHFIISDAVKTDCGLCLAQRDRRQTERLAEIVRLAAPFAKDVVIERGMMAIRLEADEAVRLFDRLTNEGMADAIAKRGDRDRLLKAIAKAREDFGDDRWQFERAFAEIEAKAAQMVDRDLPKTHGDRNVADHCLKRFIGTATIVWNDMTRRDGSPEPRPGRGKNGRLPTHNHYMRFVALVTDEVSGRMLRTDGKRVIAPQSPDALRDYLLKIGVEKFSRQKVETSPSV